MTKLKPCPFCGAKGEVYKAHFVEGACAGCSNSKCEMGPATWEETREEAVRIWNTRRLRAARKGKRK